MPSRAVPWLYLSPVFAAVGLAAFFAAAGWHAQQFQVGDFIQYWLAGRALLDGADVYDPVTWRALHAAIGSAGQEIAAGSGFLYPLPTALYAVPLALLPLPLAGPLYSAAQALTAFGGLAALGRRLFTFAPRRDLPLLLILAAVIEPEYLIGNDGNLARFLVGIVAGALALLLGGRPFAGGMLLGLATVKPHLFVLFAPVLILACPRPVRLRFVAGGLATVLGSVAVTTALRPAWIAEWVGQALGARGIYGPLNFWGLLAGGRAWVALLIVALALLAFAWWSRAARPSLAQSAAAALGLSLFFAPYTYDSDLAVLLVGVPVVLATIAPFPGPSRAAVIAVLVLTSPALVVLSAATTIPVTVLLIPDLALTGLVVGTQLLAVGRRGHVG